MDNVFIIDTKRKDYQMFNGYKCKVITVRPDNTYEVFVAAFGVFIILEAKELVDT